MNKAVIAQEGAPRELYEQPSDAFVAGFMGDANRVRGTLKRLDATWAELSLGPVTLSLPHRGLQDGPCDVAIRPEAIELLPKGDAPLAATVKKSAYLGQLMEYTLDTPIGALFAISTAVARPLAVGAHVGVALATTASSSSRARVHTDTLSELDHPHPDRQPGGAWWWTHDRPVSRPPGGSPQPSPRSRTWTHPALQRARLYFTKRARYDITARVLRKSIVRMAAPRWLPSTSRSGTGLDTTIIDQLDLSQMGRFFTGSRRTSRPFRWE